MTHALQASTSVFAVALTTAISTQTSQASSNSTPVISRKAKLCCDASAQLRCSENLSLASGPHSRRVGSKRILVASVDSAETETASEEPAAGEPVTEEPVAEEELEYVGDDNLVMYFKAEGTLPDAAYAKVQKALEGVEGVTNVKVTVTEGCAQVECTKMTTVQATGVASGIVDVIQKQGFKMQNLILGFDDEEEPDLDYFSFQKTEFADDESAQRSM
eukprot:jgi/Mesen1/4223/ME000219S03353